MAPPCVEDDEPHVGTAGEVGAPSPEDAAALQQAAPEFDRFSVIKFINANAFVMQLNGDNERWVGVRARRISTDMTYSNYFPDNELWLSKAKEFYTTGFIAGDAMNELYATVYPRVLRCFESVPGKTFDFKVEPDMTFQCTPPETMLEHERRLQAMRAAHAHYAALLSLEENPAVA